MSDIIYAAESYEIIGACMSVHSNLGSGFSEPVYQEALKYELQRNNIPHSSQPRLRIRYKNIVLGKYYRADFLCFEKIIIEIKAFLIPLIKKGLFVNSCATQEGNNENR